MVMPVLANLFRAAERVKFSASALPLFEVRCAAQLTSSALERAGRLAEQLRASGFEENKVVQIIRALFSTHLLSEREAEQQMERAFDVWDEKHRGVLDLAAISHDLSSLLVGDLERSWTLGGVVGRCSFRYRQVLSLCHRRVLESVL